jgi:chromosome segregation ATPase
MDNSQLESEQQEARRQADSLNDRTTELVEALRLSESRLAAEISRSAENAAEAVAQLQDSEQEKELILLQLKQVQDELGKTFQTLQGYQSNNRQLEENVLQLQQQHDSFQTELEGLAQECRHLFLHSQLLDTVDRTRLRRIQHLMRQSLRA